MALSSVADSTLIGNYAASQTAATKAATETTSAAKSTLIGNYDTFLKILTAQLKNQDPTAPMDASQFTQQLVQYSSVEQQLATNDKLDKMLTALNSNGITPLLSYVGQYVETAANGQMVVQGGTAKLAYNLPAQASSVAISVQDSKGNVVAQINGPTAKGLNRVAWDGTLDSGETAPDGTYKFSLVSKDMSGEAMTVDDTRIIGLVTGIETDSAGATTLKIGDLSVKDTAIKSVFAAVGTANNTGTTTGA
ncbi:MAG: flagellar hook capping FlgD N-terminal domain-containing protein [Bdellovibrionales bacterium]|jgi:flagellar basal-body rod modification protein FlgD